MRWAFVLAAAWICLAVGNHAASAAAGAWQSSDQSQARLISAVDAVGSSGKLALGVELRLHDGWKTYWRTPGEAGLAPTLDWTGSQNFRSAKLAYPAPERFEVLGLQTIGYAKHVILPLDVDLAEPGKAFSGKVLLNVLVCERICVPQTFDLTISLPAGTAGASTEAQSLNRFQNAVPQDGRAAGLALKAATSASADGQDALEVEVASREPFARPDVFPELPMDVTFARPRVRVSADGFGATITLPLTRPLPPGATLAGKPVTLTLVDGDRAAEFKTDIARGSGRAASQSRGLSASLIAMIGIAVLGGFILNFMPCVLPILSIKIVSFAKESGKPPADIRRGMLATAAGIFASMLLIAAALIALKSAGFAIGWGIQFQQPLFIAAMALIVTLFAANMWGLFEINLHGGIANFAVSAGGEGSSVRSNFLMGAFATLLATPCSAPFVGTAVGFALGQGPLEISAIFTGLGVGLGLPYLALAAAPRLARFLPRPGAWMVWLRAVMGLALAMTAAWLAYVFAHQAGLRSGILLATGLAALVACLALAARAPRLRPPALAASVLLGVLALGLGAAGGRAGFSGVADDAIAWEPLETQRIKGLVAQGKTVFVDITADWCLTCKANKRLILDQPQLADRIARETVAMRGDWTSPDPKITAFLASFGKYGVPFNVVFGPGSPAGIALPELLTSEAVSGAIDKAAAPGHAEKHSDDRNG